MDTAINLAHLVDASACRFKVQPFAAGLLSSSRHNPTIGIRIQEGSR
jgi:hypothetical protein